MTLCPFLQFAIGGVQHWSLSLSLSLRSLQWSLLLFLKNVPWNSLETEVECEVKKRSNGFQTSKKASHVARKKVTDCTPQFLLMKTGQEGNWKLLHPCSTE